jgi:hypothetical protein
MGAQGGILCLAPLPSSLLSRLYLDYPVLSRPLVAWGATADAA